MTKLLSLLFTLSTITACAFDAPDEKLEADLPTVLDGIELETINVPAAQFETSFASHRCSPDEFVGCSDGATNAVFCGEDGRSLVKEECAFGCDADGCNECEPNGRDCSPAGELISHYELHPVHLQNVLAHD